MKLTLAGIAAVATAIVGVASANAGTFAVNIDAWGNGAGCNLFAVWGSVNEFSWDAPCNGYPMSVGGPNNGSVPAGTRVGYQTSAPAGIAIVGANVVANTILNLNDGKGWGGGGYWAGGGHEWIGGSTGENDGPFSSSYWGFSMVCGWSTCSNYAAITLSSIQLIASEGTGPSLAALGSNNLWYQGGNWVWNSPGNSWPITLFASDASGVCSMSAWVNGVQMSGPTSLPNTTQWQQCPDPTWTPGSGASVDTRDFVAGAGPMSLQLGATNAAGVQSLVSETLSVDNEPVSVSLNTPNDSNPSVWVNHAVTVDATASAGPSGIGSVTCSVDSAAARAYAPDGVTIDGTGVHTASCTATNRAIDPQGSPNSSTTSTSVKIDETPPSVRFEPANPSNPTQLIADTSDGQSGVASGALEMRPAAGGTWEPLSTQVSGGHLVASFNDAGLSGPYVFQATSCDQVGNCASTDEDMAMPVRTAISSAVSFATIANPLKAKKVKKHIRVGWHWRTVRRHGRRVRVKAGGHEKTITVVRYVERCTRKRVKTRKHRSRIRKTCKKPHVKLVKKKRVAYGKSSTVHGLVTYSDGVPVAGVPVEILTAPANGTNSFALAATRTTDASGQWTASLPPGPSRIVEAAYGGSATTLPAAGQAAVVVPARVKIKITPRVVPWGSVIRITGQVVGGYVPAGSNLLRLNVGIGKIGQIVGLPHIRPDGRFVIIWRFDAGQGVIHPWFSVGTLSEAAFPFAPGTSRRITVTLGKPTPHAKHHRRAHHHKARHHKHKHKRRGKRR